MIRLALVRDVSPRVTQCELTHLDRTPIDFVRAEAQHARYVETLQALGCQVERLPPLPDLPDGVFVEDTAVILDELAVITRPGAPSRRTETKSVAAVLGRYRALRHITSPGTLDGGDVLRLGRTLFVGQTPRTNAGGIAQLATLVKPAGYDVCGVAVTGCLHLKSAVTEVADATILLNSEWVDRSTFRSVVVLEVSPAEPFAANALRIGSRVIYAAEFPRTRVRLEESGIEVLPVEAGELAKAEGGVTCCSLIVNL
jgi:dimethylargininase